MKNRLKYLKENYQDMSEEELAVAMEVSVEMVQAMKKHNDLNEPSKRYQYWTDEEDKKIKELYPGATWNRLFKEFPNRNRSSIVTRANLLGVKRLPAATRRAEDETWKKKRREGV